MTEPTVAICNPTDGYTPRVAGSTRDHCMVCAAEVWVSPSSRLVAEQFLCTDCAPGVIATAGNPVVMPLTPEQIAELRAIARTAR